MALLQSLRERERRDVLLEGRGEADQPIIGPGHRIERFGEERLDRRAHAGDAIDRPPVEPPLGAQHLGDIQRVAPRVGPVQRFGEQPVAGERDMRQVVRDAAVQIGADPIGEAQVQVAHLAADAAPP